MTVVCHTLRMSRRTGYYVGRERPTGRYQLAADAMVLQQIQVSSDIEARSTPASIASWPRH